MEKKEKIKLGIVEGIVDVVKPNKFLDMIKGWMEPSMTAKEQHEKQFGIKTEKEKKEKAITQKDFTPYAWLVLGFLLLIRISH